MGLGLPVADSPPVDHLPPFESRMARERRELDEQEKRSAAERRRERRGLDTPPITFRNIDARIALALGEEGRAVLPIVAEAINELVDAERERHKSELLERTRSHQHASFR
jgi:hypothetical protein